MVDLAIVLISFDSKALRNYFICNIQSLIKFSQIVSLPGLELSFCLVLLLSQGSSFRQDIIKVFDAFNLIMFIIANCRHHSERWLTMLFSNSVQLYIFLPIMLILLKLFAIAILANIENLNITIF